MRRMLVVIAGLAVAGCGALKDAFTAHADVAASAEGHDLSVDRLAGYAAAVKQGQLDEQAMGQLANLYVDYTLFALALADGRALTDSATTLAAQWPTAATLKFDRFHSRLLAPDTALTAAQVDSAYKAGDQRLFQHILIGVPPNSAPTVEQQKRRQIDGLLAQARAKGGANFGQLAAKYSDDPGSKRRNGLLGVSGRGAFVQAFEDAAWALPPGGVSDVVRSPYGFHIIRRPPLAEVADSFRAGVQIEIADRYDSVYIDRLQKLRDIKVQSGAPAKVRQAMQDINAARGDHSTLVTFSGGRVTLSSLVRWLYTLPPDQAQSLPMATDDQITEFLKVIAQREILLLQADSAGAGLTAQDWDLMRNRQDTLVGALTEVLGLSPALFKDSASTQEQRERLAVAHVDTYLDALTHARTSFVPLPIYLSDVLRAHSHWSVSPAAITASLARAEQLKTAADSTRRRAPQQPPPATTKPKVQ